MRVATVKLFYVIRRKMIALEWLLQFWMWNALQHGRGRRTMMLSRCKIYRVSLLPIVCLWMSMGCSGGGQARVNTENALPAPPVETGTGDEPDLSELPPEYKILPLDELEFKFEFQPEFNEIATVRPDGRITLQKLGDLYVEGMTPTQVDALITQEYMNFTATPDLTVFVRKFTSHTIYVLGEVRAPGVFDIRSRMTVYQAVAIAGGPVRGAKMGSVVLLRRGEDGNPKPLLFDLSGSEAKKGRITNDLVAAQDIIYVPRNFISDVSDFLNQIYAGLLPPVESYLRALRVAR